MKRAVSLLLAMLLLTAAMQNPPLAKAEQGGVTRIGDAPEKPAEATAVTLTDAGLSLGGSCVRYPAVTGMADEALQQRINDAILTTGQIESRLTRMTVLMSLPVGIDVSYTATLTGDVLSVAFLADGALETERSTQEWSAVNINLRTGESIPLDALFTDAEAANDAITALIENTIEPELSDHLGAAELLPLPDVFSLTEYGITFHYPIQRFETLAERAGTITILWSEIADVLDLSDDSILTRLGVPLQMAFPSDAKETLRQVLSDGVFPGIPASLGDHVQSLIDTYALLNDPDLAGSQRLIALEDGAFRGVSLLTDNLTDSLDSSVVQVIRTDRLMLCGLITGQTTQAEWREALGEPDSTAAVSTDDAESRRMVAGQTDYYALWEDATLCLHADEDGVLRMVMLMQAENQH